MDLRQKIFYHYFIQGFMKDLLEKNIPVEAKGLENVPRRGSALFIANHRCWLDPIFISMVVSRPVQWAGIDFHFKIPVVRRICKSAGIIPVSIEGGKKSSQCIKIASDILQNQRNQLVGIFPEGVANFLNPSEDEKVIRFHTGFARIALQAKVPIIPIAVIGENEKLLLDVPGFLVHFFTPLEEFEHGAKLLIYEKVKINIGKPINLDKYYNKEIDINLLHKISSRAKREVVKLYNKY